MTHMIDDDEEEDTSLDVLELEDTLDDAEKVPDLPPGLYTAEVQSVEKRTSERGNEYYNIRFVVPQNKLPADMRDFFPDGASLYWNRQMANMADARAKYNMKQFYLALGLSTKVSKIDPNDWMGRSARLKVAHEKYRGNNTVQVKSIEAAEVEAPRRAAAAPAKQAAGRGRR